MGFLGLAAQLVEAGRAPDVGGDAPVLFQQFGGGHDLAQDGAGTHQLDAWRLGLALGFGTFAQLVQALQDARFGALGQGRVAVVLVHHGDVVEDVLLFLKHPAQAVMDDHRQFVVEGRVVGDAVRDHRRLHVAVAVLVLQALAVQRRAAGGAAEQEAARRGVAGRPGQVADALEAEHRVVDVERDHRHVGGAVRRRGGDPGARMRRPR